MNQIHWGIWCGGGWLRSSCRCLFFTTSIEVAIAMLEIHQEGQIRTFERYPTAIRFDTIEEAKQYVTAFHPPPGPVQPPQPKGSQ